jgi:phosphoribosylformylglycinamidine (FGAM) synthase PurS component
MGVTIIKNGVEYTMGYDPCHYEGVKEFYEEALANGEIESYTIDI